MNFLRNRLIHKSPLLIAISILLIGCSPMNIKDFKDSKIKLIPEEFFVGNLVGNGSFFSRFGENKMFRLELTGRIENNDLLIDETATYQDGEVTTTSYRFEKIDANHYKISSPGFVKPIIGELYGNALHWTYHYKHKTSSGETVIKFDDWMVLHEDGILLDRAFGSKWGIDVGEIVMSLQRVD